MKFWCEPGLISISGLAHFCCQSPFCQHSKYKNWKSALPGSLNKEKPKWVSFLLLYLSTTTGMLWILAAGNQSLMCFNSGNLSASFTVMECFGFPLPNTQHCDTLPTLFPLRAKQFTSFKADSSLFLFMLSSASHQLPVPTYCVILQTAAKLT